MAECGMLLGKQECYRTISENQYQDIMLVSKPTEIRKILDYQN